MSVLIFLRRTRLSADPVTVYVRLLAASFRDDVLEISPKSFGCFFAYNAPDFLWVDYLADFSVFIINFVNEIRLVIHPSGTSIPIASPG